MKKTKMNCAFVILHYMTLKDTIACIESIRCLKRHGNVSIIVVDNASPNNSGQKLLEEYSSESDVKILVSEKNAGFAKGNNIGYSYAKNVLDFDFLVICNNDIEFVDRDFLFKVEQAYRTSRFDVAGPDVFVPSCGMHQNPAGLKGFNRDDVVNQIAFFQERLLEEEKGGMTIMFKNRLSSSKRLKTVLAFMLKAKNALHPNHWVNPDLGGDLILHGSCLIFSAEYCKREDFAFWPGTFMYFEEPILQYYCRKRGYVLSYLPNITVHHNDDSATNSVFSARSEKKRFIYQQSIQSGHAFLCLIDKMDSE